MCSACFCMPVLVVDGAALLRFPQKPCAFCQGSSARFPGKQGWPCRFPGLSALAHNPCEQQLAEVGGEGLVCFPLCCLSLQEAYVCLGSPPRRWGRSALSLSPALVQQWCPRVGAVLRSTAVPSLTSHLIPSLPQQALSDCASPGRKEETVTVYPADVVLFEGILAFYSQEVRDLFRMKLFVDTDADTRLSRRGEAAQKCPSADLGTR